MFSFSSLRVIGSDLKPVGSGFGRYHSVDQSISSRTRGEDKETQQATAILEQLTSNFDSDHGSRPSTPDLFPDQFKPRQRKGEFVGGAGRVRDLI